MKGYLILSISLLCAASALAQSSVDLMQYEPSADHPFGQINPSAPAELADFAPMIGMCDCWSLSRNPDGSWQDTLDMVWKFKYIMNGTGVQDEVWREGEMYAGSIRQFQPDSGKWVVSYFSYPAVSTSPGVWLGNKQGDDIVLKMPQKAPNGMEGFSRLTFHSMSEEGYSWNGEWVSENGQITYPFWKIGCKKRKKE